MVIFIEAEWRRQYYPGKNQTRQAQPVDADTAIAAGAARLQTGSRSDRLMDRDTAPAGPLRVPGLSASGQPSAPAGRPVAYDMTVTSDAMAFAEKRKR